MLPHQWFIELDMFFRQEIMRVANGHFPYMEDFIILVERLLLEVIKRRKMKEIYLDESEEKLTVDEIQSFEKK